MKHLLSFTIVVLVTLVLFEVGARVYFSFKVGPSILLYGTSFDREHVEAAVRSDDEGPAGMGEAKTYLGKMSNDEWKSKRNVVTHANSPGNYSKYFPNQKRVDFDIDTGESFEVTINSRGVRGEDFSDKKKPGVIRVITLGSSSTFGYFDRDDETYPAYLEEILNKSWPGDVTVEVINLGVPHLKAENILDLFLAEGVDLDPDVVTFYEGNNDAGKMRTAYKSVGNSSVGADSAESQGYFITVDWIKSLIDNNLRNRYAVSDFEEAVAEISEEFVGDINRIYQECSKRGILFVVANQQKNSQTVPRNDLKGMTYQEEVDLIMPKLTGKEKLTQWQVLFLSHAVLVKDLEVWAQENNVPFVDAIAALDNNRDVLVSWVHLSPRGNQMLAEALAEKILSFSGELNPAGNRDM